MYSIFKLYIASLASYQGCAACMGIYMRLITAPWRLEQNNNANEYFLLTLQVATTAMIHNYAYDN